MENFTPYYRKSDKISNLPKMNTIEKDHFLFIDSLYKSYGSDTEYVVIFNGTNNVTTDSNSEFLTHIIQSYHTSYKPRHIIQNSHNYKYTYKCKNIYIYIYKYIHISVAMLAQVEVELA